MSSDLTWGLWATKQRSRGSTDFLLIGHFHVASHVWFLQHSWEVSHFEETEVQRGLNKLMIDHWDGGSLHDLPPLVRTSLIFHFHKQRYDCSENLNDTGVFRGKWSLTSASLFPTPPRRSNCFWGFDVYPFPMHKHTHAEDCFSQKELY